MSRNLSALRREGGISLEKPQWKRALAPIEGKSPDFFFFLSCGGVLLELQWGTQGPDRGASGRSSLQASRKGPLGIPLHSRPGQRSSSIAEAGTSGFLSRTDMDLGVPLGRLQGSQASSCVEPCKSALLLSRKSSVRLPVGLTVEIDGFLLRRHRPLTPAIVF